MVHSNILFYHYLWRAISHIQNLLKRASGLILFSCVRPLANYTFVCKLDQQHHNVLPWFMESYQTYLTFVGEGFQPQRSFMFAQFEIKHSCANMVHNTIMIYHDLWRAARHIQHLLKRASGLNTLSNFLMWVILKQLIVSVIIMYSISWLSRNSHLKY